MLEIKNITKVYETEGFKQKALDDVSVNFRECEFASILGPSGSGKTTFLNIIGGLDHYTSGDLIINEKSTKKYKDSDWDSYRNHRVGFVFQSYNLIGHQSILSNVRLALTLSGISKKEALERAKKALCDVGLEDHIYKRPNQLSGGQMQRVAIARALVNDPDILLADEPTGALDSETSIQIMELLKKISKTKLVIMVTHNPELAEQYSSRIINLKDGHILSDTNPFDGKDKKNKVNKNTEKKTYMSFKTALSLSFNNLMTKKGRTILVSFAGSIGIIGIALILAVSTGFQNYVDNIQEETLTSYPLSITKESADIASTLLAMQTKDSDNNKSENKVIEQQYITSMLSSISANDLKSFNSYLKDNYNEVDNDLSTFTYSYSVDPLIYTVDSTNKLSKLNPSSLFSTVYNTNYLSSVSMGSIFSQMMDDQNELDKQYDVLAGRWPKKYDEMIIVLSERNSISDLLVYSLGLRDTDELTDLVTKIMRGESVDINNTPLEFTYDDLLNVDLRLIEAADTYKYNKKYDVYEDMSDDDSYMKKLYDDATRLKIVGIVCAKEGTTSQALMPGVNYRSDLVTHIINYASRADVVKKQLKNKDRDVFSGGDFKDSGTGFDFEFSDLVSVDEKKLADAFNIKIDESTIKKQTEGYMNEISNAITTDITFARDAFNGTLKTFASGLLNDINEDVSIDNIDSLIDNYLNGYEESILLKELGDNYVIGADVFKTTYSQLLKGLMQVYISTYDVTNGLMDEDIKQTIINNYLNSAVIVGTADNMAKVMTEAVMKKTILTKVGELTLNLSNSFASAFDVNPDAITSAFKLNFTEDELMRVMSTAMNRKESNADTNLLNLGYQDLEEPTYISFYFNSFDGKEHFLKFIDKYNKKQEKAGNDDKVINYSDLTGILMDSVKTIVNAVSYVLIAFVSISLVVSSIMIGIITYISVYERTKEIGILRSIGASKRNISSIFNAETFIVGLLSGLIGIGISYSFIPIINSILHKLIGNIPLYVKLNIDSALLLVGLSIILTLIGGLIPARAASKKDPVEALRSE